MKRALPPQTVYRPFETGAYRMAMGLVAVSEADWFEFDQRYPDEMAERRRLLDTSRAAVFGAIPNSDRARTEALALIASALTTHHPDWFSQSAHLLRNRLTGEIWDLEDRIATGSDLNLTAKLDGACPPRAALTASHCPLDPLELAGRLVQEDLCLIQDSADGPIFTAAVLCFPSRWRLMDKLGKPLSLVHGPVPLYADRLARPVDRFMRHVKPGHIASRLNWSVLDDPVLFQPGGKWRVEGNGDITAENAGERLFLRVERQTLRRLPESDAVLFGIRVHVYGLGQAIDRPAHAVALADAVRNLPRDVMHYKSMLPISDALLGWLDRRAAARA